MQNSTIRMALRKSGWLAPVVLAFGLIVPALPLARAQREITARPKADIVELPARSKRWALVIGVDKYESGLITPLIGAANDARELADALVNYAGFPREQVIVLSTAQADALKQPKRNAIFSELDHLNGQVPADGLFLFAFSGHGVLDDNDNGYLLPADAASAERNTRLLQRTAVAVSDVQDEIRRMGVRQVIVLLDACRNNPIASKGGGDNDASSKLSESFDFNRRNAEIEAYVTFYATQKKMRAYEDPVRRQGYFSYAFVEGLKGAAANERGEVTLARLIAYLEERVPKYVRSQYKNASQVPRTVVDGFKSSDLVLAVAAPPPRPPRTSDPCEKEDEAWTRVSQSANASAVRAFLNEYPNCANARNARVLLAELASPAPTRPDPPAARMSVAGVALSALAPFTTVTVDANGKITERRANQESWGYVEDLGNGARLEMVEVPPGDFLMGEDAAGAADYEKECARYFDKGICGQWAKRATPQRRVNVNGFLMGKYEVTQAQWKAVMGALPPNMTTLVNARKGDDLPTVNVSWDEARDFIRKLNEKLKLTRSLYRLPSEAEWEYAARAGSRTPFAFGETISPETATYGWVNPHRNAPKKEFLGHPVKVGSYAANAFGLYDLHGNVWEWCEDDWHDSYVDAPTDGRAWVDAPSRGLNRVKRGGGWGDDAVGCRSANRSYAAPGKLYIDHGFRLLRTLR